VVGVYIREGAEGVSVTPAGKIPDLSIRPAVCGVSAMAMNALNSRNVVEESGEESDPLGELMVMTDEEDNGELVPDTPAKR
jgi:hypothetical protein